MLCQNKLFHCHCHCHYHISMNNYFYKKYMRENSAKYYVAESIWMIIYEFMTKKAGKYSQCVNSVTVTTLPCIIVTGDTFWPQNDVL